MADWVLPPFVSSVGGTLEGLAHSISWACVPAAPHCSLLVIKSHF